MNRLSTSLVTLVLTALMLGLTGCNLFDGLDSALAARTNQELITEGNLALESGDFAAAEEHFDKLLSKGSQDDSTMRGKGETTAGKAGFSLLKVLDALQNGAGPYDTGPVCFRTVQIGTKRSGIEQGVTWMSGIAVPNRADRLSRGLMKLCATVNLLLEKYDTNGNHRLDQYDEIDFNTNDKNTSAWPQVYQDLITGPSPTGETLEQAFADLAYGFDGRGASWSFITPIIGQTYSGTFTDINRDTILALGNLADRIAAANPYFDRNLASFSAAIRLIDGAE